MHHTLFTTYYTNCPPNRQAELDYCMSYNAMIFNCVCVLVESEEVQNIVNHKFPKATPINLQRRPTYNDFLAHMDKEEFATTINILANTDIFFPKLEEVEAFYRRRNFDPKLVLALSRWDWSPNGELRSFLRPDSQDAWIFIGRPSFRTAFEYSLGVAGCDNRFAYDIEQNGYTAENPANQVHIFHYHDSNSRNYVNAQNEAIYRVPPPYKLITPY